MTDEPEEVNTESILETGEFENDPEMQEMKAQILASQKTAHKREATVDMQARLEKTILEATAIKMKEEIQQLNEEPGQFIEDRELNEGIIEEMINTPGSGVEVNIDNFAELYEDYEPTFRNTLDRRWERLVIEDTIEPDEESEEIKDPISENRVSIRLTKKEPEPPVIKQENKVPNSFLYDLLLGKYNFHKVVVQEYEYIKKLKDHEPFLQQIGSADYLSHAMTCIPIYFCFTEYRKAEEILNNILLKYPTNIEALYWQGIIAFYTFKTDTKPKERAQLSQKCLLKFLEARVSNKEKEAIDIMALWTLMILSLEIIYRYPEWKIEPSNPPEAYSVEITKIDDYLGYISWIETYLYIGAESKQNDAKDILWQLIMQDTNRPEAYIKLWTIYFSCKATAHCLDLSERLFLEGCEYEEPEYNTVIIILYAKSAMLEKQFLISYQKLQYQYLLYPTQPFFLYYFGKIICLTENEELQNTALIGAMSALEEALLSCHESRHGKIHYWLGLLYSLQKDTLSSLQHYQLATKSLAPSAV